MVSNNIRTPLDDPVYPGNAGILRKMLRFVRPGKPLAPPPPTRNTSTAGTMDATLDAFYTRYFMISDIRLDVYDDVERMEDSVDVVAAALDELADEAVNSEGGSQVSYRIIWDDSSPKRLRKVVEDTLEGLKFAEKAYAIARDTLLYGDTFMQYVLDDNMDLVRLMYMPPHSICRNEDGVGMLKDGSIKGEWAFEQYVPRTDTFLAGFYPWQIEHLRWNRRGSSPYGRSVIYTARRAWRKLEAMQEALCVNWLTRAFARLLFEIDVTGKEPLEAQQAIMAFKNALTTEKVASGVLSDKEMSVVKDLFIGKSYHDLAGQTMPGLTGVKVLDTASTGFSNLDPVEYFQTAIITSLRVPKAYLGLERDINAKSTLSYQDRRFARTVRRVQAMLSEYVVHVVNLTLILKGVDPTKMKFTVEWPNPSRMDVADEATAMASFANAASTLINLGICDPEYVALQMINMTPAQWAGVKERVAELQAKQAQQAAAAQKQLGGPNAGNNQPGNNQPGQPDDPNDGSPAGNSPPSGAGR